MAAEDDGKTEDPTGKKLSEARNKGMIGKSQDFQSALVLLAGTCFGLFFVVIRLGDDGTLWPLAASKATGLLLVLVVAFTARRGPAPLLRDRAAAAIALLAGLLDVLGNALFVFAARAGMLSVAGVLSSLYPASTVLLARLVYGERLRPIQRFGLVVAVAGVGLVTSG